MPVHFSSPEEAIEKISQRIQSNDFWTWVTYDPESFSLVQFCERTFYHTPEQQQDFIAHSIWTPDELGHHLMWIFFGHKKWMTKATLEEAFLLEFGPDSQVYKALSAAPPTPRIGIFFPPSIPSPVLMWFLNTFEKRSP